MIDSPVTTLPVPTAHPSADPSVPDAGLTDAEQDRTQALEAARADSTRRQYASAWRIFTRWAADHGHPALPATPEAVAAYLTHRVDQGAAPSTVRTARAAIGAAHRDAGLADPGAHDGVRRTLKGLCRKAAGRGRGQAAPLTAAGLAAILDTADQPRRRGRGWESEEVAAARAAVDKAIASLLFQGGLRRSEATALTWADVTRAADGKGVRVRVRRSKTDQEGEQADVRYLKGRAAAAVWALRGPSPDKDAPVLNLVGDSVARRLTEAARAAGIEERLTSHSGRVGLASELTARGASTTEAMLAGGWKNHRMVARYSADAHPRRGPGGGTDPCRGPKIHASDAQSRAGRTRSSEGVPQTQPLRS